MERQSLNVEAGSPAFATSHLRDLKTSKYYTGFLFSGQWTRAGKRGSCKFECIVIHDACAIRDLKFNDKIVKAEDVYKSTLATIAGGGYGKETDLKTFKENEIKYLQQKLD